MVGDLGYSLMVEPFADRFPDRFINAGVAEQNMTGPSCWHGIRGLSRIYLLGANFATFRCAEQIRNDIELQAAGYRGGS